ncbi:MAG TPA: division/cell wall cluster transcriptional repressor MraZ [Chloroflexota bacterium]|nr:division/cell wall cluster transcriptional repressor MraZ [Chloroflexota bacterium]
MFLGEFQHSIDDKGRLAIPAKFRAPLADGLVLTRGLDRCLYVWTLDQWRELSERLGKLPIMQADARRVARHFFSGASDTSLDKMGRIVLPQFLREYAELGDEVVVAGLYSRIEIWSQENWRAERSLAEEQSSVFAEHLSGLGI